MPVLQPLPVDYDASALMVTIGHPIISIKDDTINERYDAWKAWIKREQQKKGRKPNK